MKFSLQQKRVLITRAAQQSQEFAKMIERVNGQAVLLPMIELTPMEDRSEINKALDGLDDIDWLVFTSENAVNFFFHYAHEKGIKFYFYPNLKIATVGEKTKMALELLGYRTNFVPIHYTAEVLAENMDEHIEGKNVLIPRSSKAKDDYISVFERRGANPMPLVVYENKSMTYSEATLQTVFSEPMDYVTFTSGSTVEAFMANLKAANLPLPQTRFISIGPSTTKTATEMGITMAATANPHTIEGLFELIKSQEND